MPLQHFPRYSVISKINFGADKKSLCPEFLLELPPPLLHAFVGADCSGYYIQRGKKKKNQPSKPILLIKNSGRKSRTHVGGLALSAEDCLKTLTSTQVSGQYLLLHVAPFSGPPWFLCQKSQACSFLVNSRSVATA